MKRILAPALALALLACEADLPVETIEQDQPDLAISDATHDGGRAGFFFLPPLVPDPDPAGAFDASLLPLLSVEICEWSGGACAGDPIATFDATGSGSQSIRLDTDGEHYIVNGTLAMWVWTLKRPTGSASLPVASSLDLPMSTS